MRVRYQLYRAPQQRLEAGAEGCTYNPPTFFPSPGGPKNGVVEMTLDTDHDSKRNITQNVQPYQQHRKGGEKLSNEVRGLYSHLPHNTQLVTNAIGSATIRPVHFRERDLNSGVRLRSERGSWDGFCGGR